MAKQFHEIRDPIHNFIHYDRDELAVIESEPFQRLRHIHQLSMSHYVYPGATHTRFEHSLGVMEVAGRIYDVVTQRHRTKKVPGLDELDNEETVKRWRKNLRIAALCHDIGHYPFSHASEGLLPEGSDHETMTRQLILSDEMQPVWDAMDTSVRPSEIVELAVEPDEGSPALPVWKQVLREIIVSPTFGADRIDYLLRDSHHAGVAYGRFDHHRLIDTMMFLPAAPAEEGGEEGEPMLGIEEGGLHAAEALLLARYFMFSQVYYHEVRRIYDIHLRDFLALTYKSLPTTTAEHLALTDVEVLAEMRIACQTEGHLAHDPAVRILQRQHFRELFRPGPEHRTSLNPSELVFEEAQKDFGDAVRYDRNTKGPGSKEFPVLKNGKSQSSTSLSDVLTTLPSAKADCVYVAPERLSEAKAWLNANVGSILS